MTKITLVGFQCDRCGHKWIPRTEAVEPRVCPKCKSPYWDTPAQQPRTLEARMLNCPVCQEGFRGTLNLTRHMVLKDRPNGEHQQWLEEALGERFAEYAFKNDRRIAAMFQAYMRGGAQLPHDPSRLRSAKALRPVTRLT